MSSIEGKMEIRAIVLRDLDAMFSIDKEIRATGKTITYANLTTEEIFSKDRKAAYLTKLLDFGLVAELDGQVRGFILGEVAHLREAAVELGVILIIGVHPDCQRRGIAVNLVNALGDKYRSKGIKRMRVAIDERDKGLIAFFERMGFRVGRLLAYTKIL